MNQKRTRVPLPYPPPYRQSRTSFWLTLLVGVLITFAIGASLYMIIDSLITGSITTNNRGPRNTWLRDLQPHKYWFEVIWQSLGTLLLLAISLFGLRIYLKARK
ncbi:MULTISPECIES: hypothetical protein [unclassified Pseudomonas]|uniref:hypothetical protein n=1 Tax=unclassified Pseudomonas TaxID=196821 RepID=UPI000A1E21F8|nr:MULTISPECIES: hypothetical protein [unclassified Pseudomonas]MDI2144279.1 hypothetical protein [Pseudomonas sp. ITA]